MRSSYSKQNNSKIIVYAVLFALVIGVGVVAMQDIQAPTEHVSQDVELKLEK